MSRRTGRLKPLLLLMGTLLLAACGQETLYTKLTEAQANEMLAVLQDAGIQAEKANGGEEGWQLKAAPSDFARSIELLHSQGYPREEYATLGSVFKKEGFVSSPVEERARLIYGLSQELSHTVSEIDGVVQARVHLAIPEADPMAEKRMPSSASVFIKYRPGFAMDEQVGKVKALIVNSVEGMSYDKVTVVTFPTQPLPRAQAPNQGFRALASMRDMVVVAALIALGLWLFPILRRRRLRRRLPALRADQGAQP